MIPEYEKSVWRTRKAVVVAKGGRGLYRRMSVGLIKSAPASAITMWTYEHVLGMVKDWGGYEA